MNKAIIIFSDNSGVWWLKWLKPGFRHCFMILETDRGCLWIDPLSQQLTIKILADHELNALIRWYREMGMRVLTTTVNTSGLQPHNWSPMTCVEVVKRLVGLRDPFVWTPWQLYQKIKKNKKRKYRKKYIDIYG